MFIFLCRHAEAVHEKSFDALASLVHSAHDLLGESCDAHGRCEQLSKYLTYAFDSVGLVEKQAALKAEAQVNGRPRTAAVGSKKGMSAYFKISQSSMERSTLALLYGTYCEL